jgi:hypothetical protein
MKIFVVPYRWSIVAVKELAGTLALTDEANWKHFASYIGFTNQEWPLPLFISILCLYDIFLN